MSTIITSNNLVFTQITSLDSPPPAFVTLTSLPTSIAIIPDEAATARLGIWDGGETEDGVEDDLSLRIRTSLPDAGDSTTTNFSTTLVNEASRFDSGAVGGRVGICGLVVVGLVLAMCVV